MSLISRINFENCAHKPIEKISIGKVAKISANFLCGFGCECLKGWKISKVLVKSKVEIEEVFRALDEIFCCCF